MFSQFSFRSTSKFEPIILIKIVWVIILGSNGVMISTRRTYRNDRTHKRVKFNDKNVFNLKAQSHDRDLDGILCEQGDQFN